MKTINIPRVYINEKNEMESIDKKIFLTERNGEFLLKFPIENEENEKITEFYELEGSAFVEIMDEFINHLKFNYSNNIVIEKEKLMMEMMVEESTGLTQIIITSKELGDEYEDIIELTYIKDIEENKVIIDNHSFGVEILQEICKEHLDYLYYKM